MENEKKKKTCIKVGGLLLMIGLGFLLWMIGTLIEFAGELEALKRQLQMYYPYSWEQAWNSPEVQGIISQGYSMLFADKAIFFIPLIISGLILIGAGKSMTITVIKEGILEEMTDKINPLERKKISNSDLGFVLDGEVSTIICTSNKRKTVDLLVQNRSNKPIEGINVRVPGLAELNLSDFSRYLGTMGSLSRRGVRIEIFPKDVGNFTLTATVTSTDGHSFTGPIGVQVT
jgi:hypothetical protein